MIAARLRVVPPLGALVLVASAAAVIALLSAGTETYLTNPVGALALAGSATAIVAIASRRLGLGDRNGGLWLIALATAVAGYLALGAVATITEDAAAIAVWSVWWAVPLVIVQLAALAAADTPRRWLVSYGVVAASTTVLGAVLAQPVDPFAGLPPAAPEAWIALPVLDALVVLLLLATVAVPVAMFVKRANPVLAAAAAMPPLLIVICFGLAIATNPGEVEPSIGSVGYLVALSLGCLVAGLGLALARPAPGPEVTRRFVGLVAGAYAAVLVILAATLIAAWLSPSGSLVSAVGIAALTLAAAAAWWAFVKRQVRPEEFVPVAQRLPLLSTREREVLALLADGVRDADIAARLHLSERTVESHLTRIFAKLGLDGGEGRNRRVLAVRAWAEAAE